MMAILSSWWGGPASRLRFRSVAGRAIVAMLVPVLGAGCATPAIWDNAGTTTVDTPVIDSVAIESNGRRVIDVTYAGPWSERSTLAVPIGDNGRPVWPFGAVGPGGPVRTVGDILSTLPANQRDAIVAAGRSLRLGGPPANATIVRLDPPTTNAAGDSCRSFAETAGDRTVTLAAYRIDMEGRLVAVSLPKSAVDNRTIPDGAIVILVPTKADRPGEQLFAARARAIALTPLTVPLDLMTASVVIPMLMILILSGFHDC